MRGHFYQAPADCRVAPLRGPLGEHPEMKRKSGKGTPQLPFPRFQWALCQLVLYRAKCYFCQIDVIKSSGRASPRARSYAIPQWLRWLTDRESFAEGESSGKASVVRQLRGLRSPCKKENRLYWEDFALSYWRSPCKRENRASFLCGNVGCDRGGQAYALRQP